MKFFCKQLLLLMVLSFAVTPLYAAPKLDSQSLKVKKWATECRNEVTEQLELLLTSGQLNVAQLFDTFYIPTPNTYPQKYQTQYDVIADGVIQPIIDKYQAYDKKVLAVFIVDANGYAPTHNSKYSKPLTGFKYVDIKISRTKRIFNDKAGLLSARNTKPYLAQEFKTDAGNRTMNDMSVPITIQGRHWGAVRVVYKK